MTCLKPGAQISSSLWFGWLYVLGYRIKSNSFAWVVPVIVVVVFSLLCNLLFLTITSVIITEKLSPNCFVGRTHFNLITILKVRWLSGYNSTSLIFVRKWQSSLDLENNYIHTFMFHLLNYWIFWIYHTHKPTREICYSDILYLIVSSFCFIFGVYSCRCHFQPL